MSLTSKKLEGQEAPVLSTTSHRDPAKMSLTSKKVRCIIHIRPLEALNASPGTARFGNVSSLFAMLMSFGLDCDCGWFSIVCRARFGHHGGE